MKNYITGIAVILLFMIFMTFQNDINLYRRKQSFVNHVANEAAASAGLSIITGNADDECEGADYASGFIIFDEAGGAEKKAFEAAETCLGLAPTGESGGRRLISESKHTQDNAEITVLFFNENMSYSIFKNRKKTAEGSFKSGSPLYDFVTGEARNKLMRLSGSRAINIEYPTAACIVDLGRFRFHKSLDMDEKPIYLIGIGVYEYKSSGKLKG